MSLPPNKIARRIDRFFVLSLLIGSMACAGCLAATSAGNSTPTDSSYRVSVPDSLATVKLERGVLLHEHVLARGTSRMKVWLYLPGRTFRKPAGLVVIAAAGNVISGMHLALSDRPEHIPYVRKGYVVVAYEVDGPMPENPSEFQALASIRAFRESRAGRDNARAALDYALSIVPAIDEKRIYAVGHSSAGTLALLFGADEPRITAIAAYAPVTDLVNYLPLGWRQAVERALPGHGTFLRRGSPLTHAPILAKKPVFLFHALNDSLSSDETERMMAAMKPAHPASKMVLVPSGGHYKSMLRDGIPKGMAWLRTLERNKNR